MARTPSGYRLSRRAVADLEDIYSYSIERWSAERTGLYLDELRRAFERLAAGTSVGRDAELDIDALKYVVGKHIVYYQTTPEGAFIVRVLHGAMDARRHLGQPD